MNTVTISSKYRVVIPRPIRRQFNLKPGQRIQFVPYKNTLRVVPLPRLSKRKAYSWVSTPIRAERSRIVSYECGRVIIKLTI